MKTLPVIVAVVLTIAAVAVMAQPLLLQNQTTANEASSPTSQPSSNVAASNTSEQTTANTPITLTLEIPVRTMRTGEEMTATITLTNTRISPITIEYFIGQLYDIIIKDAEGRIVYRYSETTPYRYMMSKPLQLTLQPGETHTEQLTIKPVNTAGQPLPPGQYKATAYLTAAIEGYKPSENYGLKASANSNTVELTLTA